MNITILLAGLLAAGLGLAGAPPRPALLSQPQPSQLGQFSFPELTRTACAYLEAQQDSCKRRYHLDQYDAWYYDQHTGQLTFSRRGVKQLVIDYEEVGSLSLKTHTWLWAWDNPHVLARVKSEIGAVRTYGQHRGFKRLTDAYWKATEYDAWEMTSIAAYLLEAQGAYRVPSDDGKLFTFMIFKRIRRVAPAKSRTTQP
jgi:hypothetical protein